MTCSTSFTWQLIRGALALASIAAAVVLQNHPAAALATVVLALVFLGGCPACRVSRLVQAWHESHQSRSAPANVDHPRRT
jgi:hypothetical protein